MNSKCMTLEASGPHSEESNDSYRSFLTLRYDARQLQFPPHGLLPWGQPVNEFSGSRWVISSEVLRYHAPCSTLMLAVRGRQPLYQTEIAPKSADI
ncbi:MAG: hypothetical protein P8J27_16595 [Mariniblastus sp.]|nr:hypothetical protein [Mariniblastus sp.]